MSVADAGRSLVDPTAYADGTLEKACAVLRNEAPVQLVETEEFAPFYALTKYADVRMVERDGDGWQTQPRHRLYRRSAQSHVDKEVRTLLRMDDPDHGTYRALVAGWFRPSTLRKLEDDIRTLARNAVDDMARRDGVYDFVSEVSMQIPLTVICRMLGVPDEDRDLVKTMTLRGFGAEDPEYRQLRPAGGATSFTDYFRGVVADRRARPTDDLSSVLAHAEINGSPLAESELYGYFGVLASAGHDTTSSAIAGGVHALIENPDQLRRLQRNPELIPTAVEEMFRWVTPVKSFVRNARKDTVIRGRELPAGSSVLLLYSSANFDDEIFEDPERFDVGRDPNPHLAFGQGAHYCLGAQLARLEARMFFTELIARLRNIELAGEPQLVHTLHVGGLKHLPIRTEVA